MTETDDVAVSLAQPGGRAAAATAHRTHDEHVPIPPPPLHLTVVTDAATLPRHEGLSYEPKLDGWRVCIHVPGQMLHSRRGSDLTSRFPHILTAARGLGSVVLDGELVALGATGRLHFEALYYGPRRRTAEHIQLTYVAFDLLAYRGRDLRTQPYQHRRSRLQDLLARHGSGPVQLSAATDDVDRAEQWISAEQAEAGIEGVIAKPVTSRYPLRGNCGWVKVKYRNDIDALVLGVLGSIDAPTALLLQKIEQDGRLGPVGLSNVLSHAALGTLAGRLRPLPGTRRAPGRLGGVLGGADFDYIPVRPGVVVEARTDGAQEWGHFRHRVTVLRARME
ncbi:hypothetical protein [Amycolatopsis sacchari]|uniref:ATP-dependent DNA ligase n=1 Tax=Amycolatopsis sacchari TaxID=115433 RepID=UPI003D723213